MENSLTDALIERLTPLVKRVARKQHKDMTILEVEDIEQQLWLILATNPSDLLITREGELREDKAVEGLLHRRAAAYCREQRVDYQHFSGAFIYSGEDVERILEESAWAREDEVIDIEGRVDVRAAFEKLSLVQQDALYRMYGQKETGLSSTDRGRVERGIEALTAILNSGHAYDRLELNDYAVEAHLAGVAR